MKLKIIPKGRKEKEKLHKQKSNSSLSGEHMLKREFKICLPPEDCCSDREADSGSRTLSRNDQSAID